MTSYKIVKADKPHADWKMWFENKQGELFFIEWGECYNYGLHINLDKMTADNTSVDCPTLNDLRDKKEWEEKYCYEELDLDYSEQYPDYTKLVMEDIDFDKIQKDIEDKGWKVDIKALKYCVSSWLGGCKSGYRDSENGVHVFIPCGINPLTIRLTTLHPLCEKWQTTYYA